MSKARSMLLIMVDGKAYRAEEYAYRSCSEVIVRGPFPDGRAFRDDGRPVFFRGLATAFKTVGEKCMSTNGSKSTKSWITDPKKLADWEPFAEAYARRRGWVKE